MKKLVALFFLLFAACATTGTWPRTAAVPVKASSRNTKFPSHRMFTLYDLEGRTYTREGELKFSCQVAARARSSHVTSPLNKADAEAVENDPSLKASIAALAQSQPSVGEYLFASHGPVLMRVDENAMSEFANGGEVALSQSISRIFPVIGFGRVDRVSFHANEAGDGFEWSADYLSEKTGRVIGTVTIPIPCEDSSSVAKQR